MKAQILDRAATVLMPLDSATLQRFSFRIAEFHISAFQTVICLRTLPAIAVKVSV